MYEQDAGVGQFLELLPVARDIQPRKELSNAIKPRAVTIGEQRDEQAAEVVALTRDEIDRRSCELAEDSQCDVGLSGALLAEHRGGVS